MHIAMLGSIRVIYDYCLDKFLESTLNLLLFQGFKDSLDDKSKANLVQIKGRFSVTSENVDLVKVYLGQELDSF